MKCNIADLHRLLTKLGNENYDDLQTANVSA